MTELGCFLMSEEHGPRELVRYACRAEEVGFDFALISDHFHPWIDRQGQSPFAWTVIGAIAGATRRLRLGTGVTCPMLRIHPAIVAQAAATAAAMMPGRFFLGVGTGENLNEHVLGQQWPPPPVRLEMLEEAVEVIRLLWRGGLRSHRGRHYRVDAARLYTLPDEPPPILVAAEAPRAMRLAATVADGLISETLDRSRLDVFVAAGGEGKPLYGGLGVCWAETEEEAIRIALEWAPTAALPGVLMRELRLPRDFEEAASLVSADDVARNLVCGPDPARHVEAIGRLVDLGYDNVYVSQAGPHQEGFFRFYEREVLPRLRRVA